MSPTVWAVTFGGTLLAAATIIAYACCRAAVREDRAAQTVARAENALEDIAASNQRALEQIELAYLRGAVSALHKAAQALADHVRCRSTPRWGSWWWCSRCSRRTRTSRWSLPIAAAMCSRKQSPASGQTAALRGTPCRPRPRRRRRPPPDGRPNHPRPASGVVMTDAAETLQEAASSSATARWKFRDIADAVDVALAYLGTLPCRSGRGRGGVVTISTGHTPTHSGNAA